jgi:hypothetical protein
MPGRVDMIMAVPPRRGSLSPNGEKDLTGLVATSVNVLGLRPIYP